MGRRVFISSASGAELGKYRETAREVCRRLGWQSLGMEDFAPEAPPPLDVCLRKVREADVFVLIVAHRYGSRPPGSNISFTEHEYEVALERGIPLQVYMVNPETAWPPKEISEGADRLALDAFKSRLKERHTLRFFSDVKGFRDDLLVYLREADARPAEPEATGVQRPVPRPPQPHYVPRYVSKQPFTGRAADLDVLDRWAESRDAIFIVHGIGGNGKSALAWEWAETRATGRTRELEGRLWWSFYEGASSMDAFLVEAVAYTTGRSLDQAGRLSRNDLETELMRRLHERPFLVVMDGLERLLRAYRRLDPSKLRDEEVDESARAMTNGRDGKFLRELASCGTSKILITTRLIPLAYESFTHNLIPGVRNLPLRGLSDDETLRLLRELEVRGAEGPMRRFFASLGNHPLLIGVVAGLVANYRKDPGNFDRWRSDPNAGGSLKLRELNLVQRRTHILAAALDGLDPGPRRVLGGIAALSGAVDYATVEAINPFLPLFSDWSNVNLDDLFDFSDFDQDDDDDVQLQPVAWSPDAQVPTAAPQPPPVVDVPSREPPDEDPIVELDQALTDLEDRGLLWWDRTSNTYDMHPVVRATAYERLAHKERVEANERIRDHFSALPAEDAGTVTTVDDLRVPITIYRALVEAGHVESAVDLYRDRLQDALLVVLSAYSTMAELLEGAARADLSASSKVRVVNNLSIAVEALGQIDEAQRLTESALSTALESGDSASMAALLHNLSCNYGNANRFLAAERALDRSVAFANEFANDGQLSRCHLTAISHYCQRGLIDDARAALAVVEKLPEPLPVFATPGEIALARCQIDHAAKTLGAAQLDDIAPLCKSPLERARLVRFRVLVAYRENRLVEALVHAEEALHLARELDFPSLVERADIAFLLASSDKIDEGIGIIEDLQRDWQTTFPTFRPDVLAAEVYWRAGDWDKGVRFATDGYNVAWGDGPPFSNALGIERAAFLLREMDADVPNRQPTDPTSDGFELATLVDDLLDRVRGDGES